MRSIWTIARHTVTQCLRMKMAGTLIAILALTMVVLPMSAKGDGTLAGRIRAFLSYSTASVSVILGLVSILVGVATVSDDVNRKLIFTVATKPTARWQYIAGRWLGLVLLNAALVAVCGTVIYAASQHMRSTGEVFNADDRRAVESDVFVARQEVRPPPLEPEAERRADRRIAEQKAQGRYERVVASFMEQRNVDLRQAHRLLRQQYFEQEKTALQTAAPEKTMVWNFSGIRLRPGRPVRLTGKVTRLDPARKWLQVRVDQSLVRHLVDGEPVRINGVEGLVADPVMDKFFVRFGPGLDVPGLVQLRAADDVEIAVEPTVQISYRVYPPGGGIVEKVSSTWLVHNPVTRLTLESPRQDPIDVQSTLVVPARYVSPVGTLSLAYVNRNPSGRSWSTVMVPHEDLKLLCRVGGFEGNFVRGMLLIVLQLAFLSAAAVFAGSFLSFAVGCLVCFAVVPFGVARDFLGAAVHMGTIPVEFLDPFAKFSYYVVRFMTLLLPDLQAASPGDRFVDGVVIGWGFVGAVALQTLLLQSLLLLVGACLIFQKRELARVQV